MEQTKLNELLALNKTASTSTNSTNVPVIILGVTPWRPTSKGNLAVMMVRTQDHGTFFPLASSISNLPSSFGKPVPANAVLTLRKDAAGVDRLNMSRLEFAGLQTEVLLGIKAMQPGTALFASAAGIALN